MTLNHEIKEHTDVSDDRDLPHTSTHTAVAVDRDELPIARLTLPASRCQTERLLAWAERPLEVPGGGAV